jgi:hypothetical protein
MGVQDAQRAMAELQLEREVVRIQPARPVSHENAQRMPGNQSM